MALSPPDLLVDDLQVPPRSPGSRAESVSTCLGS
jgi:hypothetical protein